MFPRLLYFCFRFTLLTGLMCSCFCVWTTSSGLPLAVGIGCEMIDAIWIVGLTLILAGDLCKKIKDTIHTV
jgi:hypothetical protein